MTQLIPIGNLQASGDLTTAANIRKNGAQSQAAVDERIQDVAVGIITSDDTVVQAVAEAVGPAAIDAVTDAVADLEIVQAHTDDYRVVLEWNGKTTDYVSDVVLANVGGDTPIHVDMVERVPRLVGDVIAEEVIPRPVHDVQVGSDTALLIQRAYGTDFVTNTVGDKVGASEADFYDIPGLVPLLRDGKLAADILPDQPVSSDYVTRAELDAAVAGVVTEQETNPGALQLAAGLTGSLTWAETATAITVAGAVSGTILEGMPLHTAMLPILPGPAAGGVRAGHGVLLADSDSSWIEVQATFPKAVLPVVSIVTDIPDPVIDRENYLRATVTVDLDGTGQVVQTFTSDFRGHGNSTWAGKKKPYRLKTDDNQSILGLPAGKHWRLLANWFDYSRLRPSVYYGLGHDEEATLGWTPRGVWVQLVINGQPMGLYDLRESVRIGAARLDIKEMKPADVSGVAVTGGWLLEANKKEQSYPDVPGHTTQWGAFFAWDNPEEPGPEQAAYMADFLDTTEAAIRAGGVSYRDYIDEASFIDWYWISEWVRNTDSRFFSSCKLHKPRATLDVDGVTIIESKLHMGPLWDADLSIGVSYGAVNNPAEAFRTSPAGWWTRNGGAGNWWVLLFQRSAFRDAAAERWRTYFAHQVDTVAARLEAANREIQAASTLDHAIYGERDALPTLTPRLTSWLRARAAWITANI